jgi:acyl-CoA reductase-like NAD-dependent aldehyde dehydrogenase
VEASAAAAQLESFSPATGERLGAVAVARLRAMAAAVEEAASVQSLWATLRLGDRARYDGALVGAARAAAGLRSARDRDRERAWRRDGLALLRVTSRWLRAMRRG